MKKIIFFYMLLIASGIFSQSYKNIDTYNVENTKIAIFEINKDAYNREQTLVLSRILCSYPDIYFANVELNGEGIVFMAKTSTFESFVAELKDQYNYTINNISYQDYSNDIFLQTYLKSFYMIKPTDGEKLGKMFIGEEDKNELNYQIASEIYNNHNTNK